MNVRQFRELLEPLPDELEVIMSKDAEGNNYSPFEDHSLGFYEAETTWYGEYYGIEEAEESGRFEGPPNAVVLWPVN